jgi:exonuclease SbcC
MKTQAGSKWRKLDWHFHTQSSYDYKDSTLTDQQLIYQLFAEKISVIAITDHRLIDVNRMKNLQNLGKGKITILPGIEFLSDARGDEHVHFIDVFSERADLDGEFADIDQPGCAYRTYKEHYSKKVYQATTK